VMAPAPNATSNAASIRGVGRHCAVLRIRHRKEALGGLVKTHTLVIYGTGDPLVRPEGGKDTISLAPRRKAPMTEGMGHAMPIRSAAVYRCNRQACACASAKA